MKLISYTLSQCATLFKRKINWTLLPQNHEHHTRQHGKGKQQDMDTFKNIRTQPVGKLCQIKYFLQYATDKQFVCRKWWDEH